MNAIITTIQGKITALWRAVSARLPAVGSFLKQHWIASPVAIIVLIYTLVGWSNYSKQYAPLLNQAQSYLNIGLYSEAKTTFQKAIDTHPIRRLAAFFSIFNEKAGQAAQQSLEIFDLNHDAELGLKKASLADSVAQQKSAAVGQQLKQLADENPNDGDIQTFLGKFALNHSEIDKAKTYYSQAIKLNPNSAEAHFGLCSVYELNGEISLAITECKLAIDVSGIEKPTNYTINLAGLYLQQDNYTEARELLIKLDGQYLNVKIELARIYLFTNELTAAIDFLKQVLSGLDDSEIMKQPENQIYWYFKGHFENVLLKNIEDKKCYVNYSLALSSYLNNLDKEVKSYLKETDKLCRNKKIKAIVHYDLAVVTTKNSSLTKQAKEFEKKYLSDVRR